MLLSRRILAVRRACWSTTTDGSYVIDFAFGKFTEKLTIDTGIIDNQREVGFDLDADLWDKIFYAGVFQLFRRRRRQDASGRTLVLDSGLLTTQMLDPISKLAIGPSVDLYASRSPRDVSSRVGVVFFHNLTGCSVHWDLDAKLWCIDYP